jgi:hypothetical protein
MQCFAGLISGERQMKRQYPDEDEYLEESDDDEEYLPRSQHGKRQFDKHRTHVTTEEVVELWCRIEQHRQAIADELAVFDDWLDGAPDLAAVWNEFKELGGVTASELQRFFSGQTFRHRPIRQRRHLRLISNKRR